MPITEEKAVYVLETLNLLSLHSADAAVLTCAFAQRIADLEFHTVAELYKALDESVLSHLEVG